MKKFFTLFTLLFLCTWLVANTVYVSGQVKYANGSPVANKAITIVNDSAAQGNTCGVMVRVKFTNANGFYSDTLSCTGTINMVRTTTPNCNGQMLTNQNLVNGSTMSVVSNFQLSCNATISNCAANFTFSNNSAVGATIQFTSTTITAGATVASYFWRFGNGQTSTIANPTHTFANSGNYNVCLSIVATNGCTDSICKTVVVNTPTTTCNAEFQVASDTVNARLIRVFAAANTSAPATNPVIERKWLFGNGDSLMGNVQNPTYQYAQAGTYIVCLRVKTQNGCTNNFCKTVVINSPINNTCLANFTFVQQANLVTFNSSSSTSLPGDSIVQRKWQFGDSTQLLAGNIVAPQHQFTQPGFYLVCLTIKTINGCNKTYCTNVMVGGNATGANCIAQFTVQRTANKQVILNSNISWVPANDSIIERKWRFGDGTFANTGNAIVVTHNYPTNGIYTACLYIKTAKGCIKEICKPIVLQDSIVNPPNGLTDSVRIVNLFPNPATTNLNTMLWSASNNIAAEIAVFDIYGQRKWSKTVQLLQGNNINAVPVAALPTGPYFFKVITTFGTKSRQFFKL